MRSCTCVRLRCCLRLIHRVRRLAPEYDRNRCHMKPGVFEWLLCVRRWSMRSVRGAKAGCQRLDPQDQSQRIGRPGTRYSPQASSHLCCVRIASGGSAQSIAGCGQLPNQAQASARAQAQNLFPMFLRSTAPRRRNAKFLLRRRGANGWFLRL